MFRTLNVIDKVELQNVFSHHSIKDDIADSCLIRLDNILDKIEDLRTDIDNVIESLKDENATDAECLAVQTALSTICQRAINHKRESVFQ